MLISLHFIHCEKFHAVSHIRAAVSAVHDKMLVLKNAKHSLVQLELYGVRITQLCCTYIILVLVESIN
jgi:hypothetical protein